jgi:hypothetical protein
MTKKLLAGTPILRYFIHQAATGNQKPVHNLNWHLYCNIGMKNTKRTGLEEIAIYYLDLNCYHAKGNLIVTRSLCKMIQKPTFNFEKSLINKVLHQFCLHLKYYK